jgi:DNA-binding NtrC family response regulator
MRLTVRPLRLGAYDFLEKPCNLERLRAILNGARRSARAQRQLRDQREAGSRRYLPEAFVGRSAAAQQVREGRFRTDLYHRLSVFRLDLPPLRERLDDLEDLMPLMIAELNAAADRQVKVIPDEVYQKLRQYDWPGNVRELRNVVERAVLLAEGEIFPEQWLQLGSALGRPRGPPSTATG